jgi:chromate reductase
MKILTISGSLKASSSNAATLEAAAMLAPQGMVLTRYAGLAELPHFNPDLDGATPPETVLELRRLVGEADGLLLSSPEYAHGIAGSFKNGLDWLVRSLEFPEKPVAMLNVAPRAHHADAQLAEVLRTMSARLVAQAVLPVQGSGLDAAGIAGNVALAAQLRAVLERLAEAANAAA